MITSPTPLPPWLSVTSTAAFPKWQIVRVEYVMPEDPRNNGSTNIYCKTLDVKGNYLAGVKVWQDWHDDRASELMKKQGELTYYNEAFGCTFFQSGDSSFDPGKGEAGPYSCYVDGQSDQVHGMGLPLRRHVQYLLVWQFVNQPVTPPDPTPTPPPTSGTWSVQSQTDSQIVLVKQ